MSDIKEEIQIMRRQIAGLKTLLEENELINDRVNDEQAMKILNVRAGRLSNLITSGKITKYKNKSGQRFFSKRELVLTEQELNNSKLKVV